MNKLEKNSGDKFTGQKGISMPELVIVLLIISIVVVIALPQMMTSRSLFRFAGMQREIVTLLREARQEAMSQRKPITFLYKNGTREVRLYGGSFGNKGNNRNKKYDFDNSGLLKVDLKYGRPGLVPNSALSDGTNLTALSGGEVGITFQPDGSVVDASDNPEDFALFFFHKKHQDETAFAVSILGAGGRIKLWRYSKGVNAYVE